MTSRSEIMRAVKSKDTRPELVVRKLVHGLGYRYRLHRTDIPGKPDLAIIAQKKAIFVHGCFWHGHDCARGARTPKENRAYWIAKIKRNRKRDALHARLLKAEGWRSLTIWECELRDLIAVRKRLSAFLGTR